jgi:hypothetical protein
VEELQDESVSKKHAFTILAVFIVLLLLTAHYSSYILAAVCSFLLIGCTGIGHNFIHHKESIYKYFFLITGFTHYEWQIMHCISHHLYPNLELDYEAAAV